MTTIWGRQKKHQLTLCHTSKQHNARFFPASLLLRLGEGRKTLLPSFWKEKLSLLQWEESFHNTRAGWLSSHPHDCPSLFLLPKFAVAFSSGRISHHLSRGVVGRVWRSSFFSSQCKCLGGHLSTPLGPVVPSWWDVGWGWWAPQSGFLTFPPQTR